MVVPKDVPGQEVAWGLCKRGGKGRVTMVLRECFTRGFLTVESIALLGMIELGGCWHQNGLQLHTSSTLVLCVGTGHSTEGGRVGGVSMGDESMRPKERTTQRSERDCEEERGECAR